MLLSCHQPNLIPWLPYFQKIRQADKFVILSRCQYEKGGYQSRFMVKGKWHGMSVNRGLEAIAIKRYVNHEKDWKRLIVKFPKLSVFNDCISDSLLFTNVSIIKKACEIMGITTEVVADHYTGLTGTERLLDICQRHGATKYLSGISGKKYLDLSLFGASGIEVIFQDESKMDKRALIEVL